MDVLRLLFEELGFTNVETFIASGNVVFDAKPSKLLEARIERHLATKLGYEAATFVRTRTELAAILKHEPFPADEIANAHALWVGFMASPHAGDTAGITAALRTEFDEFHFHDLELFWMLRRKMTESGVSLPAMQRQLKCPVTFRTARTLERMLAKYPGA